MKYSLVLLVAAACVAGTMAGVRPPSKAQKVEVDLIKKKPKVARKLDTHDGDWYNNNNDDSWYDNSYENSWYDNNNDDWYNNNNDDWYNNNNDGSGGADDSHTSSGGDDDWYNNNNWGDGSGGADDSHSSSGPGDDDKGEDCPPECINYVYCSQPDKADEKCTPEIQNMCSGCVTIYQGGSGTNGDNDNNDGCMRIDQAGMTAPFAGVWKQDGKDESSDIPAGAVSPGPGWLCPDGHRDPDRHHSDDHDDLCDCLGQDPNSEEGINYDCFKKVMESNRINENGNKCRNKNAIPERYEKFYSDFREEQIRIYGGIESCGHHCHGHACGEWATCINEWRKKGFPFEAGNNEGGDCHDKFKPVEAEFQINGTSPNNMYMCVMREVDPCFDRCSENDCINERDGPECGDCRACRDEEDAKKDGNDGVYRRLRASGRRLNEWFPIRGDGPFDQEAWENCTESVSHVLAEKKLDGAKCGREGQCRRVDETLAECRRMRGGWAWTCDHPPLNYNHCGEGELLHPKHGCQRACPNSGGHHGDGDDSGSDSWWGDDNNDHDSGSASEGSESDSGSWGGESGASGGNWGGASGTWGGASGSWGFHP